MLRRGEGLWLAANDWGTAIRYNGLGRYEDALAAAERAVEAARGLGPSVLLLAELIEAAARSGQAERATGPLAQLAEIADAAGTEWALRPRVAFRHPLVRSLPDVGKCRAELLAGADPELAEHLGQVPLDRARAEEQLGADLRVRLPVGG